MSEVQERIAHLVESGRVSPGEGRELLGAVAPPQISLGRRVLDPFAWLDARNGLVIAGVVLLAQLGVSRLGVRFDGALDMHIVPQLPSLRQTLLDALVSWPLLAIVLWAGASIASKGVRLIDVLWMAGVARLPLVLGGIINRLLIANPEELTRSATAGQPSAALLWVALVTLPLVGWMFLWLYLGYRTASGTRGARSGISFVLGILVAEVASKALLFVLSGPPSS